jgi:hypothetical protein
MEGLVILHEAIHEIHHKKISVVLLKLILKKHMTRSTGIYYIR